MAKTRILSFAVAFIVFVADQGTKHLVLENMRLHEVIRVFPFFNLVYYRNTGSAFGLFSRMGNPFFVTVSVFAICCLCLLIIRDRYNAVGYSLILGGAAGNLADRLTCGFVIDFLELYAGNFYWPAFNVADSALTLGIIMLLAGSVLEARRQTRDGSPANDHQRKTG